MCGCVRSTCKVSTCLACTGVFSIKTYVRSVRSSMVTYGRTRAYWESGSSLWQNHQWKLNGPEYFWTGNSGQVIQSRAVFTYTCTFQVHIVA
jgi:hypothetical protein